MGSYLPFPSTLPPGFNFQDYKIQHYCSHGSDTINYVVRDKRNRIKILKECFPHVSHDQNISTVSLRSDNGEVLVSQDLRDRFKHGAEVFAKINHSNMMNIDEIIEAYGTVYVVGEYIDGPTISDYSGGVEDVMVESLIDCLKQIHLFGYVLKGPSTKDVMVNSKGQVKIVDFSSVRVISPDFHPSRDFRIMHRLLNHMEYLPFPPTIREEEVIQGYKILSVVGDGSDCITYKVKRGGGIKVLKEFFPHSKSKEIIEPEAYRFNNGRIYFSKRSSPRKAIFENGAKIFQEIAHPVLMQIEKVFHQYNTCYVIGEFIDGLHLFPYKSRIKPSQKDWQFIFRPVLECLKVFHQNGWIQGDISSSNILMQNNQPRIVDFGSVKQINGDYSPRDDYLKLGRLISTLTGIPSSRLEDQPEKWIDWFFSL